MATTIGSFSAIDDTEVDAESPITETLITRLRDNSYWIDAGTRKTTETDSTKVLKPDGSGGVLWGAGTTATNGAGAYTSATAASFAKVSNRALILSMSANANAAAATRSFQVIINTATDVYYATSGLTATISGTYANIGYLDDGVLAQIRLTSGNYEIIKASGAGAYTFAYIYI